VVRIFKPKYAKKLIAHVERTGGMKFKKKPTFHMSTQTRTKHRKTKLLGYNLIRLIARKKDGKIVDVIKPRIFIHRSLMTKRKAHERAAVALHELRENLYFQNIKTKKQVRKMTQGRIHRKVERYTRKDEAYINRLVRRGS